MLVCHLVKVLKSYKLMIMKLYYSRNACHIQCMGGKWSLGTNAFGKISFNVQNQQSKRRGERNIILQV